MTDAIAVAGLCKSYRGRRVLDGADFRVAVGEIVGLVGPNGAGKSTLLRTLVGLVARSTGSVAVLGLDPAAAGLAIRRRTAYLPGETGVYLQMTGEQFLAFALGFHAERHERRLRDLRDGFGLPLRQRVRTYSAGMKQKLALLATLSPDVELYLLDEPDRALDASARLFLREVLLGMHREGRTIVLSSHHLAEVETITRRLEFLLDGAFVAPHRLAEARARLRRWPRIRLRPGAALPAGTKIVREESDGTLVVETDDDPAAWLSTLPAGVLDTAEVGIARLDDLYQLLLAEGAGGPR